MQTNKKLLHKPQISPIISYQFSQKSLIHKQDYKVPSPIVKIQRSPLNHHKTIIRNNSNSKKPTLKHKNHNTSQQSRQQIKTKPRFHTQQLKKHQQIYKSPKNKERLQTFESENNNKKKYLNSAIKNLNKERFSRIQSIQQQIKNNYYKKNMNLPTVNNNTTLKDFNRKDNDKNFKDKKQNKQKELKTLLKRQLKKIQTRTSSEQSNKSGRITDQSIFEYCIRVNKNKLKYPQLATLLEKLQQKQDKKKATKQVSIQTKIQKYLKKIQSQNDRRQMQTQTAKLKKQDQKIDLKNNNNYTHQKIKNILNNVTFPSKLPPIPNSQTTSNQLFQLGRNLFQTFQINKKSQITAINVQKYRNCIHFSTKGVHILWYDTGRFFIGQYKVINKEGIKQGYGIQLIPQKSIYEGEFLHNRKSGYGTIKFQNGSYYVGQFFQGYQNGKGKLYQNNTILYDGQWKQGELQGFGKLYLNNQQVYQGNFIKGVQNGHGVLNFKNGDTYNGNFLNGKFHGIGSYKWFNGQYYQGQFFEGHKHGTGIWKSNKINGKHDEYCGEYKFGQKSGTGKYIWENGRTIYEGEFQNDKKHGIGVMIQKQKVVKALWNNDHIKKIFFEDINPSHSNRRFKLKSKDNKKKIFNKHNSIQNSKQKLKFKRICGCKEHAHQNSEFHQKKINGQSNNKNNKQFSNYNYTNIINDRVVSRNRSLPAKSNYSLVLQQLNLRDQPYRGVQQCSKLSYLYT